MDTVIDKDTPLYSSRTIQSYMDLLTREYPQVDQKELLDHANMKPLEVIDEGHWFTQEQINRFHDRLVVLSGNPDIAFEAGKNLTADGALGALKQYILSFMGPANVYTMVGKITPHLTRTSVFLSRRVNANTVEITVTFREGVNEQPFQCRNRIASLEAVLGFFDYRSSRVEHPECIFKGGKTCRYIISWEEKRSTRVKKLRSVVTLLLLAGGGALSFSHGPGILLHGLPYAALAICLLSLWAEYLEKKDLQEHVKNYRKPTTELVEQIRTNYDHATVINEIGQAISAQTGVEGIVESVAKVMEKRMAYDRGLLLLADEERRHLVFRAGYGLSAEERQTLEETLLDLEEEEEGAILSRAFFEQQPQHVTNLDQALDSLPPKNRLLAEKLGVKSFLCCPIVCNEKSIGVLAVDYVDAEKHLVQSDINLLMGIAPVLGVRINNATLLEEQMRQNQEIHSLERARAAIAAEKEKSDRLAEDLQEVNEDLKNFAYIVSHDLRAPLVNIKGFSAELNTSMEEVAEILNKCREAIPKSELKLLDQVIEEDVPEALEFINSSVARMDGQINGILKLSRLGRRELQVEEVDTKALVEGICATIAHQLASRQATVEVMALPIVRGDKVSLEQIFGNLLDNGVKYLETTRPGALRIESEETESEHIFRIIDNGRGIAPEDMEKVFAIFRRVGRQDTKGEGLGLAYVKTLVRRLGGRIWCESKLGEGTTFFVALPTIPPQ